jgi:trigger factor
MLYADMKMSVDGETIASEDNFDLAARDVTVQGVQLTGFGDAVVGKEVDQQVTFEAEVQDDHENIDIRGKTAKFEFTLREIKRFEVPSVDAEFLSTVGFDSEDELRKVIRANLEARLDGMLGRAMREQIGEYLVEKTEFEIPEGLSQRQAERAVARRMIEMLQAGLPQAEVEKSLDEMRAKARDQVVRDLKLYFILEKIADEREVDVPEERINAAIAEIARQSNKRFDRVRDELSKGDGLSTLYLQLRDEQVLELLLADAEITETERPKKKSPKKKAAKKKKAKKRTKKE